nr:methyltransferase [uncultured Desulfobulbus sp.]
MIRLFLFAMFSLLLLYVSRNTVFRPRTHGFYRFFAWECILALVLLNAPFWLQNPLASFSQVMASLCLLFSLVLAVHGFHLLKVIGKPNPDRPEHELLAFEKTSQLVTVGVYQYIRHPLYASLLLLAWGAFFKHPSPPAVTLACVASFFLTLTAKRDEVECLHYFGQTYRDYMQGTKKFIPFLF